ncbi:MULTISPECIES: MarR family transcriptional regulator [Pseudonocardia]|uniref:MarR family protein n=2 Tax=Pseudonocardia TaxID=1847 RepID=A0A1Y2MVX0_PSEAH|nr:MULTISPECIES: MarR family transcriptional regulator [Pseudonocardia]OSY39271.1 MarR family protein [Pseudonocardia autotrophica]TDN76507.1 MarR family protein [Pseudonocardia autotrophica]BBG00507.1 hypothetical protein Pdca_17160 [Pseudonocardia autotrophica]GEC26467.1 hypothetical protein PSA01_34960 [Pseudonocardia saturnea]
MPTDTPDDPGARRRTLSEELAATMPRWGLVALYRMRVIAQRHLLSFNELVVLTELLVRPDGLSGSEVAAVTGLGSSGVTQILTRLEERDLIVRDPDPDDRRRLHARVASEARERLWSELTDLDLRFLLDGIPTAQVEYVSMFLGRATDRGYRQVQTLRDRLPRDRAGGD